MCFSSPMRFSCSVAFFAFALAGCGNGTKGGKCGDGVVQTGEQCDDGNQVAGDGCESDCTMTPGGGGNGPVVVECTHASDPPLASGVCQVTPGSTTAQLITAGSVLTPGKVFHGGQVLVDDDRRHPVRRLRLHRQRRRHRRDHHRLPDGRRLARASSTRTTTRPTISRRPPPTPASATSSATTGASACAATPRSRRRRRRRPTRSTGTSCASSWAARPPRSARAARPASCATSTSPPIRKASPATSPSTTTPSRSTARASSSRAARTPPSRRCRRSSDLAYQGHVSEGIDAVARNEFLCLSGAMGGVDITAPRSSFVHAVGLLPADYAEDGQDAHVDGLVAALQRAPLRRHGAGHRRRIASACNIALGTDWTPSGSINVLRELACADSLNQTYYAKHFTDEDLWLMVTRNAAASVNYDDVIGTLKPGLLADIAIFDGTTNKDHRAVIAGAVETVVLVERGGKALYGDADVVGALATGCDAGRRVRHAEVDLRDGRGRQELRRPADGERDQLRALLLQRRAARRADLRAQAPDVGERLDHVQRHRHRRRHGRRRHRQRVGQLPDGVQPDPPRRQRRAGRRRRRRHRRRLRSLPDGSGGDDLPGHGRQRPRRRRHRQRRRQLPERAPTPIRPTPTATTRATPAIRARCRPTRGRWAAWCRSTTSRPRRRCRGSRWASQRHRHVAVVHGRRPARARRRATTCRSSRTTAATSTRTTRASSCSARRRPGSSSAAASI